MKLFKSIVYCGVVIVGKKSITEMLEIYFSDLKFSHGMRQQLVRLVYEISRREDIKVEDIFESLLLEDMKNKNNKGMVGKRRIEALKSFLEERRYPNYTSRKEKVDSLLRSLGIPQEIHIHFSPYFEHRWLKIEFKIRSPHELMYISKKLLEISKNPVFSKMFDFI